MAEVFTLDGNYLAAKRKEIKSDIASARYKVGSSWYPAQIQKVEVLNSGIVEVSFIIDHTVSGNITVTAIELYDRNGQRIGAKDTKITRADATEGILYVCRIGLFQVVEATSKNGAYNAL